MTKFSILRIVECFAWFERRCMNMLPFNIVEKKKNFMFVGHKSDVVVVSSMLYTLK